MPYLYAIAEKVYDDTLPTPNGYRRHTIEYVPTSKEVAETHDEGCYKLVTHAGEEMTSWNYFYPSYRTTDTAKFGKGKPLKDVTGTELAAGDFVMTTNGKYTNLVIQEVVSFTPQKIRVRNVNGNGDGSPKNPSDVIKVDKSLFF